jgi:site-specific DNA-methyltransferase (adenine-specific)
VVTHYYADESVVLYHGDNRPLLAAMPDASVDLVLTDPPYSDKTHKNASTNARPLGQKHASRLVEFTSVTDEDVRAVFVELGRVTRRWVVATMEWRHVAAFDENPPAGLRLMRFGVWVKPDGMPQLTGDRPAQGWEAIAYLHRVDVKPSWNGGGKHANFTTPVARGDHPTQKPLALVADLVRLFSDPGVLVLDPFAGSGTTLRAAKDEGRRAVGIELDGRYCKVTAARLAQGCLFGGAA